MKIVERIQFATQQVEKNVIREVQRMIKQASDQLRDEILGEVVIGFNRLEGILENLSMCDMEMNFMIDIYFKDTQITMGIWNLKEMRISRKRMATKVMRLMKRTTSKETKQIDPPKEIELMKAVSKKKRKLKCNEKK